MTCDLSKKLFKGFQDICFTIVAIELKRKAKPFWSYLPTFEAGLVCVKWLGFIRFHSDFQAFSRSTRFDKAVLILPHPIAIVISSCHAPITSRFFPHVGEWSHWPNKVAVRCRKVSLGLLDKGRYAPAACHFQSVAIFGRKRAARVWPNPVLWLVIMHGPESNWKTLATLLECNLWYFHDRYTNDSIFGASKGEGSLFSEWAVGETVVADFEQGLPARGRPLPVRLHLGKFSLDWIDDIALGTLGVYWLAKFVRKARSCQWSIFSVAWKVIGITKAYFNAVIALAYLCFLRRQELLWKMCPALCGSTRRVRLRSWQISTCLCKS